VAHHAGEAGGVLAHTKPTKRRPATAYKVSEGEGTLYGTSYRAGVVHASAQDKRRPPRLARDIQAAASTLPTTVRTAAQQEYFCRADADAAAGPLRAVPTPYPLRDVTVEERPVEGRGRPSAHTPRPVKARRYRLKTTMRPHTERLGRLEAEAGGFVLRTQVPTAGDRAQSAREILTVSKEQPGTEQNYGCLQDPVIVNSLFLKKPERMEALGLVWWLALLLWRLMARQMRAPIASTGRPLTGWEKKPTEGPTACMRMTKCAGVLVCKVGPQRQLARPLSAIQPPYLVALGVAATCCTLPTGSPRTRLAATRLAQLQTRILRWLATAARRTRGCGGE
jgi:hypothetical protein